MATMCLPYDGLTKLSILGKEERQEQIYSLCVCPLYTYSGKKSKRDESARVWGVFLNTVVREDSTRR